MVHNNDIPLIRLTGNESFFTGLNSKNGAGLIVCKKQNEAKKAVKSSDIPKDDWELILAFDEPEHLEDFISELRLLQQTFDDLRTEQKLKELKDKIQDDNN